MTPVGFRADLMSRFPNLSRRCAWVLLPAVILLTGATGAQAHRLRFDAVTADQGLPHTTVRCVLQDQRGFLWIGTEDGLARYDGYTFAIFRHDPDNPASLADNFIWSLHEDAAGRIWIGTNDGGIEVFSPDTGAFTRFGQSSTAGGAFSEKNIRVIQPDAPGALWIGTNDNGLFRIHPANAASEHWAPDAVGDTGISHRRVLAVVKDRFGDLWVGTEHGLNRLPPGRDRFIRYLQDPRRTGTLGSDNVQAVLADREGAVWIGTERGLYRFDRAADSFTPVAFAGPASHDDTGANVTCLYQTASGRLWAGTTDGLFQYDPGTGHFTLAGLDSGDPAGRNGAIVVCLFEDRSGTLWVGTAGQGLYKFSVMKQKFRLYRYEGHGGSGLSHNIIRAIAQDRAGYVWVGTIGGGLNRFDPATDMFRQYRHRPRDRSSLSDDKITSIMEDSLQRLWVGTWGGGLNRLNPARTVFTCYRTDSGLNSNIIQSVFQDRTGIIWVGTEEGLARYEEKSDRFVPLRHRPDDPWSISDDRIQSAAMLEDESGDIWIGTWNGLNRYHRVDGRFTAFHHDPRRSGSLSDDRVISLHLGSGGELWAGTHGGGLNRLDRRTGVFCSWNKKDGLPNDVVYAILEDTRGGLWLSTNNGLCRFDPRSGSISLYGVADGLQDDQFFWGASCRVRNGEMYFGGINGFNRFVPEEIVRNTFVAPIVFTGLSVFNQPIFPQGVFPSDSTIELNWRQNHFSFEFAALDFTDPSRNRYMYRLEGFDSGWIMSGAAHHANYTNIGAGRYTFRVKGANSDGVWNDRGAAIRLRIVPPPWKTWWAYAAYALAGLLVVFATIRFRTQRKTREFARKTAENLRILNEALTSTLRMEDVMGRLLDSLAQAAPYTGAVAYLLADGKLHPAGRRGGGEPGPTAADPLTMPVDGPLVQIARTHNPLIVDHTTRARQLPWAADFPGVRQWLCIPLVYRQRMLAVIGLGSDIHGWFDEDRVGIAFAFSGQAGIAVENARLFGEVERLAVTDELTGLFNRRHFFETATHEFRRARRYERQLSVIMADIDRFKTVNDTFGHDAGDGVLRGIAGRIQEILRDVDVAGRYGGDEFIILMPESGLMAGGSAAERLREKIAGTPIPVGGGGAVSVTLSMGVAALSERVETLADLVREADAALYQAKQQGRNRVVAAGTPAPVAQPSPEDGGPSCES